MVLHVSSKAQAVHKPACASLPADELWGQHQGWYLCWWDENIHYRALKLPYVQKDGPVEGAGGTEACAPVMVFGTPISSVGPTLPVGSTPLLCTSAKVF